MNKAELDEFYRKNGYILVKNALNAAETNSLRKFIENVFDRLNRRKRLLMPSETIKIPEIYRLPFNERIVEALKMLLSPDYAMLPDIHIQRNMFGYGVRGRGGWHTDAEGEGTAKYLLDPDYRFVKCGLFLQENSVEWGGGIDIVAGGHKYPFSTWHHPLNFKAKSWLNRLQIRMRGGPLKVSPGDFVAFDSRLPHSSSWPHNLPADATIVDDHVISGMPAEKSKIVVYWDACRPAFLPSFLEDVKRRAAMERNTKLVERIYSEYIDFKFPESYPADFVAMANDHGIHVATVNPGAALAAGRP